MSESFCILIDRLKGGQVQKIEEVFAPEFLGVDEPDLKFHAPVKIKGDAYLTDTDLILRLQAKTSAVMPCVVCNQLIETELKVENYYLAQPINEIRDGVFNYTEQLREALLIELPKYVECNSGKCPERTTLAPYLRSKEREEKTTYFPFADMDQL